MVDFCVVLITLLHGLFMMNVYSNCMLNYVDLHMLNLTNIEGNHYKYYTSYYPLFNNL